MNGWNKILLNQGTRSKYYNGNKIKFDILELLEIEH